MTKRSRRKKNATRFTGSASRRTPPIRVQLAISLAVSFVAVTLYYIIDKLYPGTWYALGTSGSVLLLGLVMQQRFHQMYFRWMDRRAVDRAAQTQSASARPAPTTPTPPSAATSSPTRRKRGGRG